MKRLCILLIAALLFSCCVADVIYVDADATKGLNNGTSWKNAFLRLEYALLTAAPKDQIWVAEGTYTPTTTADRTRSFSMVKSVKIYGGFDPGSGVDLFEERDWDLYPCILSGDIGLTGVASDNAYHVFYHPAGLQLTSSAVLDGFTITEGWADGIAAPNTRGAGMYNDGSSPKLANCIFEDNYASEFGGAVYNNNSSNLTCIDCRFVDNRGSVNGGAICNIDSAPTVDNCLFGESMLENFSYEGGAISNNNSFGLIRDCVFQYNDGRVGGAIFNDGSAPTITGCTFERNSVSGSSLNWRGGAIANVNGSDPNISDSLFEWNLAPSSSFGKGGAIYCDTSSAPRIASCRFEHNISHGKGGAIYCDAASPVIEADCEFIGNDADYGGAIYCTNLSAPSVSNSTFEENEADQQGGAIYCTNSWPDFSGCQFLRNTSVLAGGGLVYAGNSGGHIFDCEITGNESNRFFGGGMYCVQSSPTIEQTLFSANVAQTGGAFGCEVASYPVFINCTMSGNTAEYDGGALFFYDASSPTLTNCMIVDNTITVGYPGYGQGGAAYIEACPSVSFINCTISNNTATASNGGLYCGYSGVDLVNSIVWGNSGTQLSGGLDVTYCDVQGGYAGTGNIDINPLFVAAAGGNYHLQRTSDCVDAGLNSAVAPITVDFEGDDRIADGDDDGTAAVDIGADEVPEPVTSVWVDDDYTPSGSNDGHTWGLDAFAMIQDGIDAVQAGGTVYVAAGTYVENLFLGKDLTVLGSGACRTIVDGNNAGTVIYINGVSDAARLDGLTLTRGSGRDVGGRFLGGGMMLLNADLTVSNCRIIDNTADYGGGMDNEYLSDPTIVNCLFRNNTAEYGGAIDNYNLSSPEVINCTFTENTSTSGDGGVLYSEFNSSPTVVNSILWDNSGGSIYDDAGCLTTVSYSNVQGGWPGVDNLNTDPHFVNSTGGNDRLHMNSPCIDSGTNLSVLDTLFDTDLDGHPRLMAKFCGVMANVDMGCYEFSRLRIGDFDDNCTINLLDFSIFSANWKTDDSTTDIVPACGDGDVGLEDLIFFAEHWLLEFSME